MSTARWLVIPILSLVTISTLVACNTDGFHAVDVVKNKIEAARPAAKALTNEQVAGYEKALSVAFAQQGYFNLHSQNLQLQKDFLAADAEVKTVVTAGDQAAALSPDKSSDLNKKNDAAPADPSSPSANMAPIAPPASDSGLQLSVQALLKSSPDVREIRVDNFSFVNESVVGPQKEVKFDASRKDNLFLFVKAEPTANVLYVLLFRDLNYADGRPSAQMEMVGLVFERFQSGNSASGERATYKLVYSSNNGSAQSIETAKKTPAAAPGQAGQNLEASMPNGAATPSAPAPAPSERRLVEPQTSDSLRDRETAPSAAAPAARPVAPPASVPARRLAQPQTQDSLRDREHAPSVAPAPPVQGGAPSQGSIAPAPQQPAAPTASSASVRRYQEPQTSDSLRDHDAPATPVQEGLWTRTKNSISSWFSSSPSKDEESAPQPARAPQMDDSARLMRDQFRNY